ncbi:MAG: tetratricopeptide repeat protein [Nannocystaceae bacterium]|nr:tetratricopeptide repeat protein [Myxococcales bacterium]
MSEDKPEASEPDSEKDPAERMDLPTWNRSRTKKRRTKGPEDDAFQKSVRSAGRGAARRIPIVLLGTVVGIGLIVGGAFWFNQRNEEAATATRLLSKAVAAEARGQVGAPQVGPDGAVYEPPIPMFDTDEARARRVTESLEKLAAEEHGSTADITGELVRGALEMRAGDHAAAEATYRRFLAGAREDHPLHFQGREGLGLTLEAQGKLEEALQEFRLLAADKGAFYRDMALWHQGRVLEALERGDEALAVYRTYNEEYPQSDVSLAKEQVRERLLELDPEALKKPVEAVEEASGELASPADAPEGS